MKIALIALDAPSAEACLELARAIEMRGHTTHTILSLRSTAVLFRYRDRFTRENLTHSVRRERSLLNPALGGNLKQFDRLSFRNKVAVGVFTMMRGLLQPYKAVLMHRMGDEIRDVVGYFVEKLSDQADARDFFNQESPDALILAHDHAGHFTTALAHHFVRKRRAVVIVPCAFPNPQTLAAQMSENRSANIDTWRARVVASLFPKWTMRHRGRRLLRLQWWKIVILEFLGLAPRAPWVHQSCKSDAICAPDQVINEVYQSMGFSRSKLVTTGAVLHDTFSQLRAAADAPADDNDRPTANTSTHRTDRRPRVLVVAPPDGTMTAFGEQHFLSYQEVLECLRDGLASVSEQFDVTLIPHPTEPIDEFQSVFPDDTKVASEKLEQLLPISDLFISYLGSPTLVWGPWARVPTLAWDPFSLCTIDQNAAGHYGVIGAVHVAAHDALPRQLAELAQPGALAAWRAEIADDDLPPLDGGAVNRMLRVVRSEVRKHSRRQPWMRTS